MYFDNEPADLDVRVHVLTNPDPKSILGQYLRFCEIYNQQRKKYGRILKTIEETIRICKEENLLSAYLAEREIEVIKMYSIIFDDNFIAEAYEESIKREAKAEGISIGEARAAKQYQARISELEAQLARFSGQQRTF